MRTMMMAAALMATQLVTQLGCWQDVDIARRGPAQGVLGSERGQAELFASDPYRSMYNFLRDDHGIVESNGDILYNSAHVRFEHESKRLTVFESGYIVDLGEDRTGRKFAALALNNEGHFNDEEANAVFGAGVRAETDFVIPELSHVYALRIAQTQSPDMGRYELIVKLLVVSLVEGDRIAFQWGRLKP